MHLYLLSSILTLSVTYSWYSFYCGRDDRYSGQDQQQRKARVRPEHAVSIYMWDMYNSGMNSSEVDVVKGIHPEISGFPFGSRVYRNHRRRQLQFNIPKPQQDEVLVKAEVRITRNKIQNRETYFQIYLKASKWIFLDEKKVSDVAAAWISLHVTPVKNIKPGVVTFLILTLRKGSHQNRHEHDFFHPVLLLSYSSSKPDSGENGTRRKRSPNSEDYEEETNRIWKDDIFSERVPNVPRRVRNVCRRKSLYIKFSDIDYDSWIVAPSGYEAFQCVGKCAFPVGEHLSPTKHAIVQTLIHNMYPSKASRACCVPTRLDPISILYLDENGVLTYRFRYRDMVVAECGCR